MEWGMDGVGDEWGDGVGDGVGNGVGESRINSVLKSASMESIHCILISNTNSIFLMTKRKYFKNDILALWLWLFFI